MNINGDAILRPTKRIKKDRVEQPLYLDSFPQEVLDNILIYTSGIPHAKNW